MDLMRALLGFCLCLSVTAGFSQADDVILRWNTTLTDVLQANTSLQNPGIASRSMAMTNIAMYDALNSISPTHQPFYSYATVPSEGASGEAAAMQAGYRVLSSIYPGQQDALDASRAAILATLPASAGRDAGIQFGDSVGQAVVDRRATDGFMDAVAYAPSDAPGHWRPDPLNPNQMVWGPEWGQIETFSIPSTEGYVPAAMPALTSQAYADAFNEVKELGAKDSSVRTTEQTEIGLFWAYDRLGMGTPMRMYNKVLRSVAKDQENDLSENARLFALASTAVADAGVVAWDTKFTYDFWRPVTGIREADTDGNPETVANPMWEPLGAPGGVLEDGTLIQNFTPPFPTYVSGHASFGGALFGSLAEFYGTDNVAFDVTSEEMPAMVRTYESFSEAMKENGRSRVYLGIHWDFDDFVARDLGGEIANFVASNHFQPVPEPGFSALTSAFLLGLMLSLRSCRKK